MFKIHFWPWLGFGFDWRSEIGYQRYESSVLLVSFTKMSAWNGNLRNKGVDIFIINWFQRFTYFHFRDLSCSMVAIVDISNKFEGCTFNIHFLGLKTIFILAYYPIFNIGSQSTSWSSEDNFEHWTNIQRHLAPNHSSFSVLKVSSLGGHSRVGLSERYYVASEIGCL